MTVIKIKDLEIFANHGVLKEENVLGQKFILSLEMDIPTPAGDDIEKTINYAEVCAFAEKFMREHTYKLIETAAAALAKQIMLEFPMAERVMAEIKKPWAPIRMNVGYVSAAAEAKWHTAYIAVGANLGDRRSHIEEAIKELNNGKYCRVIKKSELIETKPVGYTEQNDFLNGCIELQTLYEPFELLEYLHKIEDRGGRTREIHWGPRTIDLDIIFYDDIIMNTPSLTIPHKEAADRYFVLKPLKEIAPYKIHPVYGETVTKLFSKIADNNC